MTVIHTVTRKQRQLELPLPQTVYPRRRPYVWLLSATREDISAFKRSLARRPEKRPSSFLLIDLATGASPCSPDDLLLLKTADRPDLDLFIPDGLRDTIGLSTILDTLTSAFRHPTVGSRPLSTLDLGLVRFVGHAKRAQRRGWGRNRFEQVLDTLMCREIVRDPAWSQLICSELLEDRGLDEQSLLRAVALRIRADAMSKRANWAAGYSEAARAYWRAKGAFERVGASRQAIASGRLGDRLLHGHGMQQLELWPIGSRTGASDQTFGFHVRRLSGMRLPLELPNWSNAAPREGMLQHEFGQTLELDTPTISRWLSGAQASSEMAGLIDNRREGRSHRLVKFVVDSELAVRAGLAGWAAGAPERRVYRLMPQSAFGSFSPMVAATRFGEPAAFEYSSRETKFHRIDLLVLTPNRNPMSIPFTL